MATSLSLSLLSPFLALASKFTREKKTSVLPFVRSAAPLVQKDRKWSLALEEIQAYNEPQIHTRVNLSRRFDMMCVRDAWGPHDSNTAVAGFVRFDGFAPRL